MSDAIREIPLNLIVENKVQLRTVNTESDEFKGLMNSIETYGFRESISVIERYEEETQETYFEIVNGLHRYTACKMLGHETIRCEVVDPETTPESLMCQQFVMNAQRVTTKPAEYGKQIQRIIRHRPELSKSALASMLCVSLEYLDKRLKISTLIESPAIHESIDAGEITVAAAVALAKLPVDEQGNYLEQAMTLPVDDFVTVVADRVNEIKAEARGKKVVPTFVAKPKMRKLGEVVTIINAADPSIAQTHLAEAGITDATEAFFEGMRVVAGLDTVTVSMRQAEWNAKQEEKKRKDAERKAKREAEKAAKEAETED